MTRASATKCDRVVAECLARLKRTWRGGWNKENPMQKGNENGEREMSRGKTKKEKSAVATSGVPVQCCKKLEQETKSTFVG